MRAFFLGDDCGGGYITMHFSKLIELCVMKNEFHRGTESLKDT